MRHIADPDAHKAKAYALLDERIANIIRERLMNGRESVLLDILSTPQSGVIY